MWVTARHLLIPGPVPRAGRNAAQGERVFHSGLVCVKLVEALLRLVLCGSLIALIVRVRKPVCGGHDRRDLSSSNSTGVVCQLLE